MMRLQWAHAALWLAVATAMPMPSSSPVPAAQSSKVSLVPARHPDCDPQNVNNLHAVTDVEMFFDSDPNPSTDSSIATFTASGVSYPMVQLANTDYIASVHCTDNTATIAFNHDEAFQAAASNWQQHSEFVLLSYTPHCGTGYSNGMHDFALVHNVTVDSTSRTIRTGMRFVDPETAMGSETMIHASIQQYQAPRAKRTSVSHSFSLDWNEYPTNSLSTQQFGTGYQLLQSSSLDIICAGCGTQGSLTFTGELDFSWFSLKSADMSLTGTMQGTLAMGIVANDFHQTIPIANTQLVSVGLPGLDVAGILVVGPAITVDAAASVTLGATGSLEFGATLDWPNVDVQFGLYDDDTQTASGLSPSLTPILEAQGEVSATLDLSLPISIGLTVNILDGKWSKSVAVVDTPTFSLTGEAGNADTSCVDGVALSADLSNSVGIDLLGLTTVSLESTMLPLFSTCLAGSAPASTTSAASTSVASTSASSTAAVSTSTSASALSTAAVSTAVSTSAAGSSSTTAASSYAISAASSSAGTSSSGAASSYVISAASSTAGTSSSEAASSYVISAASSTLAGSSSSTTSASTVAVSSTATSAPLSGITSAVGSTSAASSGASYSLSSSTAAGTSTDSSSSLTSASISATSGASYTLGSSSAAGTSTGSGSSLTSASISATSGSSYSLSSSPPASTSTPAQSPTSPAASPSTSPSQSASSSTSTIASTSSSASTTTTASTSMVTSTSATSSTHTSPSHTTSTDDCTETDKTRSKTKSTHTSTSSVTSTTSSATSIAASSTFSTRVGQPSYATYPTKKATLLE